MSFAVSVVCVSRRPHLIGRLFTNFARQNNVSAQLILCGHGVRFPDLKSSFSNVNFKIFEFSEDFKLGEILNYGIDVAESAVVCKWDDDDYYGRSFLAEAVNCLLEGKGDLVGKASWYAWLEGEKKMFLKYPGWDNRDVDYLAGGTLAAFKNDLLRIQFPALNLGEDQHLVKSFIKSGRKVWSSSQFNYMQVRGLPDHSHAWSVPDEEYIIGSRYVAAHVDIGILEGRQPSHYLSRNSSTIKN